MNGPKRPLGDSEESAAKKSMGRLPPDRFRVDYSALQRELTTEKRRDLRARIEKDLFEEDDAAPAEKKKPAKRPPRRRNADDSADEESDDAAPEDALKDVEGEEVDGEVDNEGGVRIEPFNLRREMEEGYFDKNGHFVERRLPDAARDAWLDEYDSNMQQGGKEKALSSKSLDDQSAPEHEDATSMKELKLRVASALEPGENTWDALRRLKRQTRMDLFAKLTEDSDVCSAAGALDIHNLKKEEILAEIREDEQHWEYKNVGGEMTFGPFTSQQMKEWYSQGWFQGDSVVEVRRMSERKYVASDKVDWATIA